MGLEMYINIPSSILISHPLPIHFQTHRMFLMWIFKKSGEPSHYNRQNLHFIKKRVSEATMMLSKHLFDLVDLAFDSCIDNISLIRT